MKSKQVQEFKETEIGKIPTDWEVTELGNVFKLSQGLQIASKKRISVKKEGYVSLLKITDLPKMKFSQFVSLDDVEQQYLASNDDIIYTRTGQVGLVYTNVEGCVHNNCFKIHYGDFDKMFVYHMLKQRRIFEYANAVAGGSVQKDLTHPAFKSCIIVYPKNKQEQKKISIFLDNLETKISNLQNQNRILEQTAQAIFQSWFVDFDGVTQFEDSELGKIPKGWSVDKLENHLELTKGVSYKSKELLPSNKALVSLKSINRGGGYTERGLKSFDGKYKDSQIVYENDIIIAQTDLTQDAAVIGKPALVRNSEEFDILIASLDLLIARPKNNENLKFYIYHILLTDEFQNHIYGYTNGTGVLHLAKDGVPSYQFLIPSKKILEKFNQIISTIIQKNHDNHSHIQTLIKTRDTLLPKLMSGEIRV